MYSRLFSLIQNVTQLGLKSSLNYYAEEEKKTNITKEDLLYSENIKIRQIKQISIHLISNNVHTKLNTNNVIVMYIGVNIITINNTFSFEC